MFNICPKDLRAVATADQRPQSTVNVKERYFYLLLFFLGFFLFLFASAFPLWNHCIWKLTYKLVRPSNSLTSRSRNDMWHCCVRATWTCICETKVMCVTPCGWENNEPPSIPCLPKSPNGVRQMGGDQSGVHELSLGMCVCVCVWSEAHVCAYLILNIYRFSHLVLHFLTMKLICYDLWSSNHKFTVVFVGTWGGLTGVFIVAPPSLSSFLSFCGHCSVLMIVPPVWTLAVFVVGLSVLFQFTILEIKPLDTIWKIYV